MANTEFRAAQNGSVVSVSPAGTKQWSVVVQYDSGSTAVFSPLDEVYIAPCTRVSTGQLIGVQLDKTQNALTSVGIAMPPQFAVTNSPLTQNGTINVAWNPVGNNLFFGAPDGGGQPVFRQINFSQIANVPNNGNFIFNQFTAEQDANAWYKKTKVQREIIGVVTDDNTSALQVGGKTVIDGNYYNYPDTTSSGDSTLIANLGINNPASNYGEVATPFSFTHITNDDTKFLRAPVFLGAMRYDLPKDFPSPWGINQIYGNLAGVMGLLEIRYPNQGQVATINAGQPWGVNAVKAQLNIGSYQNGGTQTIKFMGSAGTGLSFTAGVFSRIDMWPGSDNGTTVKTYQGLVSAYTAHFDIAGGAGSTMETLAYYMASSLGNVGNRMTIGTMYGFYFGDHAGRNITNAWGFYQAGATDKNFFGGRTIFGGTAVDNGTDVLQVNGNSIFTGDIRATGIPNAITDNVVYYDNTTKKLSWGTAPTGGGGGSSLIINNNADNRILTANGNTSSIDAESNLTFDGSLLSVNGSISAVLANVATPKAVYYDPITHSFTYGDAAVVGDGNYYAPMWTQAGGDLTIGSNTFTHASLIGATNMNFIIVNKEIEQINDDYTFDNTTGTITRLTGNWFIGDVMITPHTKKG